MTNFFREEQILNFVLDEATKSLKVRITNPLDPNGKIEVVLRDEAGNPFNLENLFPSGSFGVDNEGDKVLLKLSRSGRQNPDGFFSADNNEPASSGSVLNSRSGQEQSNQTLRQTGIQNDLKVLADISLHDHDGEGFRFLASSLSRCLPIQIVGNDGLYRAFVDSVGRIATNANVTFPEVFYLKGNLLNASSKNLNVNGATTPVPFRFTPTGLDVFYVESLSFLIEDQGDFLPTNFGALATLANGLQINIRSKGSLFTMGNLRDNADIRHFFPQDISLESVPVVLQANRQTRASEWKLQNRIALDPGFGDYVEVIVRDNLTGLNNLSVGYSAWRTNG